MASGPITSWQIDGGTMETVMDFIFLGSKITADGDCSHETKICLLLRRKAMTNLDSMLKSRDVTLPTKVCKIKLWFFQQSCMDVTKKNHKDSWVPKNWCFWSVVLEKTLESPVDCKEIQPVHPNGNQSWIFIGRTDAEAEVYYTLATWCNKLTHYKRPWCLERLKAKAEGDERAWDVWMASPTWWTWAWASSGSWWWGCK